MVRLTIAPIQNAKIIEARPMYIPSIHPKPSISLASPSPIHLPRDKSQIRKKGRARIGPDRKEIGDGKINKELKS